MRGTVRPKSLLSGLVHYGTCGGPCSLRGQGRFACSTHNDTGACDNSRTITRVSLEERVLVGLKDRLIAPGMVDEAIRSFVEETNRLNHAQRADRSATESKLDKIKKGKTDIVDATENGRYSETLMDRLLDLEVEERCSRRQWRKPLPTRRTSTPTLPEFSRKRSSGWQRH